MINATTFRERRDRLRAMISNAVVLLDGAVEDARGDMRGGFFQDASFGWLSGWLEPGARMLLLPIAEKDNLGDVLFLPDQDPERTLWTGPMRDARDEQIRHLTGFGCVRRACEYERTLMNALRRYPRTLCLSNTPSREALQRVLPLREVASLEPLLAQLRMRKSDAEVAAIREAIAITIQGQLRSWRSLQRAHFEYEVVADVTHEFLRLGAERHAFTPIVAAGANGCALHYTKCRGALEKGMLTVVDIGAERAGYCGDLTRTIPVGGRFSQRQKNLYQAVLHVQKSVIAAVRPGMSISRYVPGSLHQLAVSMLEEIPLRKGGRPLSTAFPHGIGHHLGAEVHDLHDVNTLLEPGMVITVEPGVYLPEEGIGIRIEDNVLVTETGCEVLSAALPKEVDEIEELLAA